MPGPAAWRVGGFRARDRQIAAPDHPGDEPDDRGADGPVLSQPADQRGHQPLGVQAGVRRVTSRGRAVADRHLRRPLVVHEQSLVLSRDIRPHAGAHRRVPGARQLQHHAADDGRVR